MIDEGTAKDGAQGSAICHSMWKQKHNESSNINERIKPTDGESKDGFINRCIPHLIGSGNYPDNEYGHIRAYGECSNIWADRYRPTEERPSRPGDDTDGSTGRHSSDKKAQQFATKDAFIINCIYNKYPLIKAVCEEEWKKYEIEPEFPQWGDKFPQKPGDDTQPGGDSQLKRQFNGQTQQLYQFDMTCDKAIEFISDAKEQLSNDADNKFSAVAVIGDRFYHNKFLSYGEISKAAESMNGAYHDINHWGTTYTDGNPNIEYIIGYQKNTTMDPISKKMKTDIFINENAPHYKTWKNFIDVSKEAGRTPNVSVSFWGSNKKIKAKELPKGINFQQYGYEDNDEVTYLYDLQFQALSTVFQGACDDKAGCGIGIGLKQDKPIVEDKLKEKLLEKQNLMLKFIKEEK